METNLKEDRELVNIPLFFGALIKLYNDYKKENNQLNPQEFAVSVYCTCQYTLLKDTQDFFTIEKRVKQLSVFLHPDKIDNLEKYKELSAVNQCFMSITNNTSIFAIIQQIKELRRETKYAKPIQSELKVSDNYLDDFILKAKIKLDKNDLGYFDRLFMKQFLELLISIKSYHSLQKPTDSVLKKSILTLLPFVSMVVLSGTFYSELLFFQAISASFIVGGKVVLTNPIIQSSIVGHSMLALGKFSFQGLSTITLSTFNIHLKLLNYIMFMLQNAHDVIEQLVIGDRDNNGLIETDLKLSVVSQLLDSYEHYQKKQFAASLRIGHQKSELIKAANMEIKKITQNEHVTDESKIQFGQVILTNLQKNIGIFQKGTVAKNIVEMAIQYLGFQSREVEPVDVFVKVITILEHSIERMGAQYCQFFRQSGHIKKPIMEKMLQDIRQIVQSSLSYPLKLQAVKGVLSKSTLNGITQTEINTALAFVNTALDSVGNLLLYIGSENTTPEEKLIELPPSDKNEVTQMNTSFAHF
jgi:hypothetical protein